MRSSEARTRAELVRQRRKEQARERLGKSAVLSTRPMAPITSRNAVMPLGGTRGRPAARRRSEAAWSMPGVEVRMPMISFSDPAAKWRLVSFGLVLLFAALLYLAGTAPALRAAPPLVSGNQRIAPEEIDAVMGMSGAPIYTLVPAELERQLRLHFPELQQARVTVGLPNEVYVDIVERTPVIAWYQDGGYTWIDSSGVAFRPRGSAENIITVQAQNAPKPVDIAVADPLSPLPFISPDQVAAIQTVAPYAPAGMPLIYDARYGIGWDDSRGWQAFFGDQARDMALKLRVYDSMVSMMTAKGIRPAFISVQYPTAPYYRMTQ